MAEVQLVMERHLGSRRIRFEGSISYWLAKCILLGSSRKEEGSESVSDVRRFQLQWSLSLVTREATVRVGADLRRKFVKCGPLKLKAHALNDSSVALLNRGKPGEKRRIVDSARAACSSALDPLLQLCFLLSNWMVEAFQLGRELRTAEMEDLRHASNFQQEILAKQREGGKTFRS